MNRSKILLKLSGSIACYKACDLISKLRSEGCEVRVVCSFSALKFIGTATLEALSGHSVLINSFQSGDLLAHIHLNQWADITVLYPATANKINQLAGGGGGDVIGDLFLARDLVKPYLVFPAMNSQMLSAPPTKRSFSSLREWGVEIFHTRKGVLACGDFGFGKILEPDEVVGHIMNSLLKTVPSIGTEHNVDEARSTALKPEALTELGQASRVSVLVTGGGTREYLDGVRFIANFSTGITAGYLAEQMGESFDVTYLHSKTARPAQNSKNRIFDTYEELSRLMELELRSQKYDFVIHMAAVGDFRVHSMYQKNKELIQSRGTKISSDHILNLELRPRAKILDELFNWAHPRGTKIIAFKLTQGVDHQKAQENSKGLFQSKGVKWVIHNELKHVLSAGRKEHQFIVYQKAKGCVYQPNKESLAGWLISSISRETVDVSKNRISDTCGQSEFSGDLE